MATTTTRKVILSMQMTLDGFVAGLNNEMDWIKSSDDEWNIIFNDLESVDTLLLGSKMYPEYVTFWKSQLTDPSADRNLVEFAKIAEKTQHIVFSKTMKDVAWGNTRIATDALSEIKKLKQQPGKNIVAWGGATFASFLINTGLINEYWLTVNPILLGEGKPLFKDVKVRKDLEFLHSQPLQSGMVTLRYKSK